MLMTAMTAQISAMRITWPVLTEWVVVINEARNDPRSTSAFGATPLAGQDRRTTAVAPMPSPAEFGVRGRRRGDVLLCHLVHAAKLYRDCPAANGSSGWCGEAR